MRAVAVEEIDVVLLRDWPVCGFPDQAMLSPPVARPRHIPNVADLSIEIAVDEARGADGFPLRHAALLELRLLHATRAVAWSSRAFVRGGLSRLKPRARADVVTASEAAGVGAGLEGLRLLHAEGSRAAMH